MQTLEELRAKFEEDDAKKVAKPNLTPLPNDEGGELDPKSHIFVFDPATIGACKTCGLGRLFHIPKPLAKATHESWDQFRGKHPTLYDRSETQEVYKFSKADMTQEDYDWYLWLFAAVTILSAVIIYVNSRPY